MPLYLLTYLLIYLFSENVNVIHCLFINHVADFHSKITFIVLLMTSFAHEYFKIFA